MPTRSAASATPLPPRAPSPPPCVTPRTRSSRRERAPGARRPSAAPSRTGRGWQPAGRPGPASRARGAPGPDRPVLLDARAEVRAARNPEHEPAELEEQRRRYLALAKRLPGLVVLDASKPLSSIVRGIVSLALTRL